ncbi:MAG TPA: DUF3568 family protein [Opitutaceae bacterium]|nr:DUF3568 family protein [Opitutaceae bacterium]
MKTRWMFGLALTAAALSAALTGCLAVAAGAAGASAVAWVEGRLDANLNADFERSAKAADLAIHDLQFAKISEKKDALEDTLVARTAGDRRVEIKVEKVTDQTSKVEIRVGVFGDEPLSLTVLDKIKARL